MGSTRPPAIRLMAGQATALGPGKAALLEALGRTGSISAAARSLGMSYRRAWSLIDSANRHFRGDLVTTATGGRGGGGARLTELGADALRRYRLIEEKAAAAVADDLAAFAELLRDDFDAAEERDEET